MLIDLRFLFRWACSLAVVAIAVPASAIDLATGPAQTANGFLRVNPDDLGAWDFFAAAGEDTFNPAGAAPLTPSSPTFTSGMFVFVGGNQRELLSTDAMWQATGAPTFASDTSLTTTVTSPSVGMDMSGDGVIDTANSRFNVTGGSTNLSFDLTQKVTAVSAGVSALMRQDYAITNNASVPIAFNMVRAHDADLLWGTTFLDDEVGTQTNGSGGDLHVYIQNPTQPSVSATVLSSPQASAYYGGKNGIDPPPAGGPAMGFGTDVQVWNAYGVPQDWANFVAGVGHNVNGNSGPAPPGSDPTQPDAFIGLAFDVQLAPGATTTISVCHTFGSNVPAPCPVIPEPGTASLIVAMLAGLGLLRRNRMA